ncbi:PLD nuclease N-terminal domain-containing protein [Nonomuraea cavernae]|uniref:PLD nuclease N-terminal domain-containing protein n=1 Tax=Nonomuraea cavernae TaxID=2045107 RepID=UPI0033DE1146
MRWNEMSKERQFVMLTLISTEIALTATAVVDLWFRPRDLIRGRKELWWPAIFVQPVGPVAYLVWGRGRRSPE